MSNARPASLGQQYLEALTAGNRTAARKLVNDAVEMGVEPRDVLTKMIWPVMEQLQQAYREDLISLLSMNLATRLNRVIADQMCAQLEIAPTVSRKIVISCGDAEPEELGGAIAAALFEAEGWDVRFVGGGVPNDELLELIGKFRPDLLCMFATRPQGVPAVRKLIDYLREVNSHPNMQLMCCGGIYKRAEGLAEEIGADLYAPDAADAVRIASDNPMRRASFDQQTVGRSRRIRKGPARAEAA